MHSARSPSLYRVVPLRRGFSATRPFSQLGAPHQRDERSPHSFDSQHTLALAILSMNGPQISRQVFGCQIDTKQLSTIRPVSTCRSVFSPWLTCIFQAPGTTFTALSQSRASHSFTLFCQHIFQRPFAFERTCGCPSRSEAFLPDK